MATKIGRLLIQFMNSWIHAWSFSELFDFLPSQGEFKLRLEMLTLDESKNPFETLSLFDEVLVKLCPPFSKIMVWNSNLPKYILKSWKSFWQPLVESSKIQVKFQFESGFQAHKIVDNYWFFLRPCQSCCWILGIESSFLKRRQEQSKQLLWVIRTSRDLLQVLLQRQVAQPCFDWATENITPQKLGQIDGILP